MVDFITDKNWIPDTIPSIETIDAIPFAIYKRL